jgi:2-dehydro-3-deoxygalactonokinase
MIGVDWGTTSFRAFRIGRDGAIRDRRQGGRGILNVQDGRFADTLREEIGPWLAAGEEHVLLSGMIGSRQGWREAPYLPCPAGIDELSSALVPIEFDYALVKLVPGLRAEDPSGVPEVMRGEETQLAGTLAVFGGNGLACLPGTHSKWARIEGDRIAGFATHMTGEAFAALRGYTILGRTMRDGPTDHAAFDDGLARSAQPGGLLHHLFGVRALALAGRMPETTGASYLSGLLIGHEVRAALPRGAEVHLIGAPELCRLYARAIDACEGGAVLQDGEAAAQGLFRIGAQARWT